jgi:hypothetical protein
VSGGKILARFDTPAHRFLFPEVPPAKGELQQLQLNKSRKYQVSEVIPLFYSLKIDDFYTP